MKAKMLQIRFRLGFCPRPRWGSLLLRETRGREAGREGKKGIRGEKGKGEREERKWVSHSLGRPLA